MLVLVIDIFFIGFCYTSLLSDPDSRIKLPLRFRIVKLVFKFVLFIGLEVLAGENIFFLADPSLS